MTKIFQTPLLLLGLFLAFPGELIAQNDKLPLSQNETNKVLNSYFSNLVTSNPNPGNLGTYASLDPINALFTLKATVPMNSIKSKKRSESLSTREVIEADSGRFSYLSFNLSGNLIDKSYATLFSNNSLNAGGTFQVQYNFSCDRPYFSFKNWQSIHLKKDLLFSQYQRSLQTLNQIYSDSAFLTNRYLLRLQVDGIQTKMTAKKARLDLLNKTIDSLGVGVASRPELIDSLASMEKDIASLHAAFDKNSDALDSLNSLRKQGLSSQIFEKQEQLLTKLKSDYDSLILSAQLLRFSKKWFTLLGGVSQKGYSTFNPSAPFSSQIAKNSFTAFNFGVAVNYIHIDKIKRHTLFFNASLSYLKDNNLSALSTTEVDDTKKIINSSGDTTRTITAKKNVYTNPVVSFLATNLTANFYYIFGKTPSGVHLEPSVSFQNNGLNLVNLTAGYILSFQNATKGSPAVNTELFFAFNDIFNQQHLPPVFWRRCQVGLSFTIPFNIFF